MKGGIIIFNIDESYVKKVLMKPDNQINEIHKRVFGLYQEMNKSDDLLESIILRGSEIGSVGVRQTGTEGPDLLKLLDRHQTLAKERSTAIRTEIWKLTDEQETINRVWVCFQTLEGKEYDYLNQLYVQNLPYKVVESKSGVSHGTFEKTRKRAILKILKLYESDLNNLEIMKLNRKLDELK